MRIAVDAMGGDYAPNVVVQGAIAAARELGVHVILVGDRDVLGQKLKSRDVRRLPLSIHHASEVVAMDESPSVAMRRKKDSSMRVALDLVKAGEAEAAVSAGNSGAFMAKAMLVLRLLPGVERPAIATLLPSLKGHTVVLDMGANVDCSPLNLVQFAVMGDVMAHDVLGVKTPRVGLLSNGEESSKGTDLTRDTHARLEKMSLNYVGYVEGRDIFLGNADVVVTDGFTGNVLLKSAEGVAKVIGTMLKEELGSNWLRKFGALLASGAFKAIKRRTDYREVGGALLLGINGVGVICHGSSNARAMRNAIRVAAEFAERRVNLHVMEALQASQDLTLWASKKERGAWK